jgi:decaprenyl-phosphate phosphoribosyltransferase
MTSPGPFVRSMRPRQWIKNLLVFAAPIAAGEFFDVQLMGRAVAACLVFCAISSATYLVNDVRDRSRDREHPTKRYRPIAAGEVSVGTAVAWAGALLAVGVAAAFLVDPALGYVSLAYLAVVGAYNAGLKDVAVIDVLTVAAGFVLRALAGGAATGVPISEWFVIVTSAGALLMVTGKREAERSDLGSDAPATRPSLAQYSGAYLAQLRALSMGVILVAYCLWAFESAARSGGAGLWYQISIVPFTAAVLRYGLLIDRGGGGEPERAVFADRVFVTSAVVWAGVYGYDVYGA